MKGMTMNIEEERSERHSQLWEQTQDWLGSPEIMADMAAAIKAQSNLRIEFGTPEWRKVSRLVLDIFLALVPRNEIAAEIAKRFSVPLEAATQLAHHLDAIVVEPKKWWIFGNRENPYG